MARRKRYTGKSSPNPTELAREAFDVKWFEEDKVLFATARTPQSFATMFETANARNSFDPDKTWLVPEEYRADIGTVEDARRGVSIGKVPDALFEEYERFEGKLGSTVSDFESTAKSTRRKRVYRDVGDDLNIDRFLTGDIDCWETRERGAEQLLVRIGIQFGFAAVTDAEVFARVASIGVAAATLLVRLGYAVEVHGYNAVQNRLPGVSDQTYTVMSVPFKQSDTPIDKHQILSLGLPTTLRIGGFAAANELWGMGFESHDDMGGVGMGTDNEEVRDQMDKLLGGGGEGGFDVYVGTSLTFSDSGAFKQDDALTGIMNTLMDLTE